MSQHREVLRGILPIPDRPHTDQIAYDAKDPDVSFPPIEPLRPPAGAPNDQYFPAIYEGTKPVETDRTPEEEDVEDADHLISLHPLLQLAMARQ